MKLWTTFRHDIEGNYIGHIRDSLGRSCGMLAGYPVDAKPLSWSGGTRYRLSTKTPDRNGYLGQKVRICYYCRLKFL